MRNLIIIAAVLLVLASESCSGDGENRASASDIEAVREAARAKARIVLDLPEGSMEQENEILSIRACESAIRSAGFEECADSFAAEAQRVMESVLDSRSVIIE